MKTTLHLTLTILFAFLASGSRAERVFPIGSGISGGDGVLAMQEYQGKLVIGGNYTSFNGHVRNNIQGWDGTQFYDMPGAFTGSTDKVYAMELFGGDLVVAGKDPDMGNVAQWDGTAWSIMGSGLPNYVSAMAVFNGELYAAETGHVHRWNGTDWEDFGSGFIGQVKALEVYNGELYVAGTFGALSGGATLMKHLARWNGSEWEQVLTGLNNTVNGLAATDEGLAVVGNFSSDAGGILDLPSWTVYDGTQFEEKPTAGGSANYLSACTYPDGGFILSDAEYSFWIRSNIYTYIGPVGVNAAIAYQGRTLVAGFDAFNPNGYSQVGRIGAVDAGRYQQDLNINNISAPINITPGLFHEDLGSQFNGTSIGHFPYGAGFTVPLDSFTTSIGYGSPWLSGYSDGVLHSSFPDGGSSGFFSSAGSRPFVGPIANAIDSSFYRRYEQVWKLDTAMINYHIAHGADADYQMPYAIATWPGNGDVANGEPAVMAPFMDLNNNGYYEPAQGDYPLIRGDQAIYTVQHTVQDPDSLHPALPMDLHIMAYEYGNANNADTWNTVFMNVEVINRGSETYTGVRFGMDMYMKIGYPLDDLVGCDTTLNFFYAYNGDDVDDSDPGISIGYGDQPPAQGALFLNHPMTAHSAFPNDEGPTGEDQINGTLNGQPFTQTGYPSHFQYPGGAYTDASAGNAPGDRRSVGSIGPYTLGPGDTLCIDLAFPYANAASGGALASLGALATRVHNLNGWFGSQGFACLSQQLPNGIAELDAGRFALYPNPTNGSITLERAEHGEQAQVQVHSMSGRLVLQTDWRASSTRVGMDVSSLPAGIYAVEVRTQEGVQVRRLVKQ